MSREPDRSPLLWILIPFSVGILIASHWNTPNITSSASVGILLAILAVLSAIKFPKLWIPLLVLAALFAGITRFGLDVPPEIEWLDFPEREARLSIRIDRSFNSKPGSAIGFATTINSENHLNDLIGKRIYFSLYTDESSPNILPGTELLVQGVISSFVSDPAIRFHDYLDSNGTQLTLTRGTILEIESPAPFWRRKASDLRKALHKIINRGIDDLPNQAQSYAAMTLGLKGELSTTQKEAFLKSGAMHLFAISGLHVGVIAICGHSLLLLFRVPRKQIPYCNTVIILIFVVTTGGAASAWRAFAMIACYYLSHVAKRQTSPINALAFSALICLIADPRQLFQAGFQMSYSTVTAILMYGIPLATYLQSKWKPFDYLPRIAWGKQHHIIDSAGNYLIGSICICIAAFTTSSILSIIYFDLFSTAGAIINLVYLPLASLVISAGFCSIIYGAIFLTPLSVTFNHSAALLLTFLDWIATKTAANKLSFVTYENPHRGALLASLVGLLVLIAVLYSRNWRDSSKTLLLPPLLSLLIAFAFALIS